MKKTVYIFPIILSFLSLIFASCKNVENDEKKMQNTDKQDTNLVNSEIDKSKFKQKIEIVEISPRSIVFFALSPREYNNFCREVGQYSKYEFDELQNNFKRMEAQVSKIAREKKIKTIYSTAEEFYFKLPEGKTKTFNRLSENKFMGHIFFDGLREPTIVEGMMSASEMREFIKEYFNLSDLQEIIDDSARTENSKIILGESEENL